MARIDTLTNFLTDVADSIRSKTGKSDAIACENFDTEIESISGGGSQKNRLPDAYQEVEYIQSSGTQYFDTGYYASGNSQYEFKFSHGSTSGVVFGAYNSAWTTGSGYYHSNSSTYYEWVHYYSNNSINKNGSATDEYEYKIDKGYVYFKGTLIYLLNTKSFTLNYPTYILAGNWAGSKAQEPISARLYYFRIRENDIAIHNYIPCYRKSDGVIGLYDLVENKFITNAGTGTFEKGPDHDTPLINLQDKSVTITENTTTNITPDQGYDGLNSVEVITDVSGSGENVTLLPRYDEQLMRNESVTGTSIIGGYIFDNGYVRNEVFKRNLPLKGLICFFVRSNYTAPSELTVLAETDWYINNDPLKQKLVICWCDDIKKQYTIQQENSGRMEAYSIVLKNANIPTNILLNTTLNITEDTNPGFLEVSPTNKMCIYICSSIYNWTDETFYFDDKFDFSDITDRMGIFISTNNIKKRISTNVNSYGVIGIELEYSDN